MEDSDPARPAGPLSGDDIMALKRARLLALHSAKLRGEEVAAVGRVELCPRFAAEFQARAAQSLHLRR